MLVRQPWSASGSPCVAWGPCGVVARVRAVVRRNDGPERRCWWSAGCSGVVRCRGGGLEKV
jgi:hypothetical protein